MFSNIEMRLLKRNDQNYAFAHFTNWYSKDDFVVLGFDAKRGRVVGKLAMACAGNGDVEDGSIPLEDFTKENGWRRVSGDASVVGAPVEEVVEILENRLQTHLAWRARNQPVHKSTAAA